MRRLLIVVVVVLLGVLAYSGYRYARRNAVVARGPLPAPSNELKFAGKLPEHPFQLQEGNVLSRVDFETPAPANSQIEIRDFILPPHVESRIAALPGPAIVEVSGGQGSLAVGEKEEKERLAPGDVKLVPAAQVLKFGNDAAYPLAVRIYLFEAK